MYQFLLMLCGRRYLLSSVSFILNLVRSIAMLAKQNSNSVIGLSLMQIGWTRFLKVMLFCSKSYKVFDCKNVVWVQMVETLN